MTQVSDLSLALHTPPHVEAGYFSRVMSAALSPLIPIETYVDQPRNPQEQSPLCAWTKKNAAWPVYQVCDARSAGLERIFLGLNPGLVVFHDFLLADYGPEPILNSASVETVRLASDSKYPFPERRAEYKQLGPHAHREASLGLLNFFTCPRMHEEYRRMREMRGQLGLSRSYYLPWPVEPVINTTNRNKSVVAWCGKPLLEDRAPVVLEAIENLRGLAKLRWLIAKDEVSRAEELLKECGGTHVELIIGRTPEKWGEVLRDASVALHLLFSAFHQTGPYLPLSAATGVPCVVSDFGASDYLPSELFLKIRPGARECDELRAALSALLKSPPSQLFDALQKYAQELHDSQIVAREFLGTIRHHLKDLIEARKRWKSLEYRSYGALLEESLGLLPLQARDRFAQQYRTLFPFGG